jgi:hypothetical protein
VWLEDPSGRRVDVFWPSGWDVGFHPLRLLDDRGQVVAREGDELAVLGPTDGIGDSICSPGAIFLAEQVEVLSRAGSAPPAQ